MDIKEKIKQAIRSNVVGMQMQNDDDPIFLVGVDKAAEALSILFEEHAQQREREAFNAARETYVTGNYPNKSWHKQYPTYNDYAADKGVEVIDNDGWIKVSDSNLPENREEVHCYTVGGRMVQASYEEHTEQDKEWFKKRFTHYRELPTPPKP